LKTEALSETLARIAPYCNVEAQVMRITAGDLPGLFDRDDIVCEAFDNPEAKAMLVQGVLEHYPGKPLVSGSGMAGIGSANDICTRQVSKNFYLCGDGVSDVADGLGLAAPRVLACAAHEALMIMRLIAGETEA
jgi:sulfur carrier protein ThiS adenylyltransferase